ncbi:MAG: hypothetical protein AB7D37_18765 [Desulfovibrio sp.]
MEPLGLDTLLICFGGGIVGAALGGLFSFVLCGLLVLAGCLVVLQGGSDFLLLQVGLGPAFGPHVGGFAAGVAAASYAAMRKNHPGDSAKDILSALMCTSWDVLLVGGIFAIAGHLLVVAFGRLPIVKDFDVLALSVAVTAILARLLFQRQMPWGDAASIRKAGYLGTAGGTLSWIPWAGPLPKMLLFGLGAGLLSASMAAAAKTAMAPLVARGVVSATGAVVVPLILGWAVAAVSLIALQLGSDSIQKVPVWHAQAVLAALAYLIFGSMAAAAVVAVCATLLQELMARMFWNHGSTHIDPPACAIAVGTFVLNCLK